MKPIKKWKMPAKLPEVVTNAVIQEWLEGSSRDEIAVRCGISGGGVSGIIANWRICIGTDQADQLRSLVLGLKKLKISIIECAEGFRIFRILTKMGVDENDVESFLTTIYNRAKSIGLGPEKIVAYLNDLLDFAANAHARDVDSEKLQAENKMDQTIPLLSQIPPYIARKKAEKNHLEQEIKDLTSVRDDLQVEKSELENSINKLLTDRGLTQRKLDWYAQVKAELERDGFHMDEIPRLRDAVKLVQEKGQDLYEIVSTYASYRALKVEKRSLERQVLSLQEKLRLMETSRTNLQILLDLNSLSVSLLEELKIIGFGYKELKMLNDLIVQINRANRLSCSDGSAVERFFKDIEEEYDGVLGFRSTKEKLRKDVRQLSIVLKRERGIFDALPHVNTSLGSLVSKGVREDQIVKISELIARYPNFIELFLDSSDSGVNAEVRPTTTSTNTLTASSSSYSITSKNLRDASTSQTGNPHSDGLAKTEYIQSEQATSQEEMNKKEAVKKGLMTASEPKLSKINSTHIETQRGAPVYHGLADANASARRCIKLATFDVTSSRDSAGHPSIFGIDNSFLTGWIEQEHGWWIQWDLGSKKNVYRIDIAWRRRHLSQISFAISVSDDNISFAEKRTVATDTTYPSVEMYRLPPDTYGQFVRITILGAREEGQFGISEIDIFG